MIVRTHRAGFLFGGNVGFHLSFSHLILAGGLSLWVYIILWLIIPKAPKRLKN